MRVGLRSRGTSSSRPPPVTSSPHGNHKQPLVKKPISLRSGSVVTGSKCTAGQSHGRFVTPLQDRAAENLQPVNEGFASVLRCGERKFLLRH